MRAAGWIGGKQSNEQGQIEIVLARPNRRQVLGALAIALGTLGAIHGIALWKVWRAVGPGGHVLDEDRPADLDRFREILADLEAMGRPEAAEGLAEFEREGRVWIAPELEGRQGLYVAILTVRRVYLAGERLHEPVDFHDPLPPGLSEGHQIDRAFARLNRAGTIYYEWLHATGTEDEASAYGEEIRFYKKALSRASYAKHPVFSPDGTWLAWEWTRYKGGKPEHGILLTDLIRSEYRVFPGFCNGIGWAKGLDVESLARAWRPDPAALRIYNPFLGC